MLPQLPLYLRKHLQSAFKKSGERVLRMEPKQLSHPHALCHQPSTNGVSTHQRQTSAIQRELQRKRGAYAKIPIPFLIALLLLIALL